MSKLHDLTAEMRSVLKEETWAFADIPVSGSLPVPPAKTAMVWAMSSRKLSRKGWDSFARRNKLTYSEADEGWRWLVGRLKGRLKEGMGPATMGATFIPNPMSMKTPATMNPAFPFKTKSAYAVFDRVMDVMLSHPRAGSDELILRACDSLKMPVSDITPEDVQLLRMAIDWMQNGAPKNVVHTGGAPGGPMRAAGPGYTARGAR